MNILVLSNTPWNINNSFGNSFSNIFDGLQNIKFANIYCRAGEPDNNLDMYFFEITEKKLLNNLMNREEPSGCIVVPHTGDRGKLNNKELIGFDKARKIRWQIMFWGRNLIWKVGRWKSKQLLQFIDEFNPDLIFQPIYIKPYINEIALFIKRYTNVPMIGYISDDNYTLKQYNFSPLFWMDRLYNRKKVKSVIEECKILYVISDIQKKEYERVFTPPCKVLTKCADFSRPIPKWCLPEKEMVLIYAGNIGAERWKSLELLCKAIEKLREENYGILLEIYTSTPKTKRMKAALNRKGTRLHAPVEYRKIVELEKKADVLVHVEGLSKKSRMAVHQSFSTKLVDFFSLGKCIFAIGTDDEASIHHLIENEAAIVAKSKNDIYIKLKDLVLHPEKTLEYGERAYLCGKKNHDKRIIQEMLLQDLHAALAEQKDERHSN